MVAPTALAKGHRNPDHVTNVGSKDHGGDNVDGPNSPTSPSTWSPVKKKTRRLTSQQHQKQSATAQSFVCHSGKKSKKKIEDDDDDYMPPFDKNNPSLRPRQLFESTTSPADDNSSANSSSDREDEQTQRVKSVVSPASATINEDETLIPHIADLVNITDHLVIDKNSRSVKFIKNKEERN